MKIRYTITRFDLLRASLHALVRNRFLWVVWAALTISVSYSWITDGKYDDKTTGYKIAMVIILAIMYIAVIFGLTALITSATILIRKHVGVLGEHTLSIEDDGLVEETDHNVSRSKWSLYHKTRSMGAFAFLYITEVQFHLIPLRRPLIEGDIQEFLRYLKEKTK